VPCVRLEDKPPTHSRFKPGQSGNPRGRPRGANNKSPQLAEERLKDIVLAEAYRTIKVHDGERSVSVPMAQAVVRALAVSGAKGNNRAANLFTQMITKIERENNQRHFEFMGSALDYKLAWTKELERRERLGIVAPQPVPHPDDIEINPRTGEVKIIGPMIQEEVELWEVAAQLKEETLEEIASIKQQLECNPDLEEQQALHQALDRENYVLSVVYKFRRRSNGVFS
jgi:Family of unknown function (DUF5681)